MIDDVTLAALREFADSHGLGALDDAELQQRLDLGTGTNANSFDRVVASYFPEATLAIDP